MVRLPRRLKKDAIVEALWEVRFNSVESQELPELVVGNLAGHWKQYSRSRLPLSNVPAPVRQQDPSLRNQPTLELRSRELSRLIKIGSNVFSYHVLMPYCGGDQFKAEIADAISLVFTSLEDFKATRFGLRYINALNESDHGIKSVKSLNLAIDIAGEPLSTPLNLNYTRPKSPHHQSLVRVASPEFVSGPMNRPMSTLIDVDVFTPTDFESKDVEAANEWVKLAHGYEKEDFFQLIPEVILDELVAEWAS